MELVSANTRNFLFLTISQYNEVQNDVRARVSMRRDQAFWEGGNSYIACESFRISAAPSPGGLYYNKIGPDFYMSAAKSSTPPVSDWEPKAEELQKTNLVGTLLADTLVSRETVTNQHKTGPTLSCQLGVSGLIGDFTAQTALDHISRYMNPMAVTLNSYVCMQSEDAPFDAANNTWIQGYVRKSPSQAVTGAGTGPSNLFMPKCILLNPDIVYDQITAAGNNYATVNVFFWNDDNAVSTSTAFKDNVKLLIASGCLLHYNHPIADSTVTNDGTGIIYILGPTGIDSNCQVPGLFDTSTGPTLLRRPIRYETGANGKSFTVTTGTINSNFWEHKQQNTAKGNFTKWNDSYLKTVSTQIAGGRTVVGVAASVVIYAYPIAQKLSRLELAKDFEATVRMQNAQEMISSGMHIEVDNWKGRDATNLKNPPCPEFPANDGLCSRVWLREELVESTVAIRRDGGSELRTVYTPNEFFLIFNRADDSGIAVPWSLQTDVNGGFVVNWNSKDSYPTFNISKNMCDSLGLNPFMWQEFLKQDSRVDSKFITTRLGEEHKGDYGFETFQQSNVTFNAKTVYSDAGLTVPLVCSAAVPSGAAQVPVFLTPVYTSDGKKRFLLKVSEKKQTSSASGRKKIFPQLLTDGDGYQYYHYQELPSTCWIGNTQEVSVESWGTFSEINLVIPNLPFMPMLGSNTDQRILCSLRIPFEYGTANGPTGQVTSTEFPYYGDLLYNSDSSRSYLKITTDQQLYDCDVEARLIRRDGSYEVMTLPYKGQFQVKLRFLQTQ